MIRKETNENSLSMNKYESESDEEEVSDEDDWGDPIPVDPELFHDGKKLLQFLKSI